MDIVEAVGSMPFVDLVIFLALFGSFILGVTQGTIRRLLGIIANLFAFMFAANLRGPLGDWLAGNWSQFPHDYNELLAFIIVFVVASAVTTIAIQAFYKRTDIYARRPIVDDALGGVLGLAQGILLLTIAVVILNSYTMPDPQPGDVTLLRQLIDGVHSSAVCSGVRDVLAPVFVHLLSFILPGDLVSVFP